MEQFSQTRYRDLLETISNLPVLKNFDLKNPANVAEVVKKAIDDLKMHFSNYPFPNQFAQVLFFKYEKPKFYSEYVYALELFTIESQRPHADETILKNYYEQELRFVRRFFDQYRFLYQYYLLDGIELDSLYFTPGKKDMDMLLPEAPGACPDFSAPGEFLFAKFIALERLQDYLMALLYPLAKQGYSNIMANSAPLRWTGDKVNLVELAYGIFNTAQVNDGDVHIADIISWLEKSFGLKLSRYAQMFSEIRNRKSVSKTRYLDHMGKMISLHIEQGDAFIPEKPRPVSGSKPASKT